MLKLLVKEIHLEIVIANNHFFDVQEIRFFRLSTLPDYHNKVPLVLQLWNIVLFNVEAKRCLRARTTALILVAQKLCFKTLKDFTLWTYILTCVLPYVLFLFILYRVVSVACIFYPLTIMALKENIKLVRTRYSQMLDNDLTDKMGGHFKLAVLEYRRFILVKIFVVMDCLKRTQVPAIYTTLLRTYIIFIYLLLNTN
jgi:hypothetical protein